MKIYSFLTLMFFSPCFVLAGTGPEVNYYRDIDYWTLEGIDEVPLTKMNEYPYFKIVKLDSVNRVVELIAETGSFYREHYVWSDNSWMTVNERNGNISHVYQYTYISKNKILILEYLSVLSFKEGKGISEERLERMQRKLRNNPHFLVSITVRDSISTTEYRMSREKKIWSSPDKNFDEKLKDLEVETIVKSTYNVVGDVLVKKKSSGQPGNQDTNAICFALTDRWGYRHNSFWPLFFLQIVDCY